MIYVFQRKNGDCWADISETLAKREGKIVATFPTDTRADLEAVLKNPGPTAASRVLALAERLYKELMARDQQPEPTIQPTPTIVSLRDRKFFGRLKWLLTGK